MKVYSPYPYRLPGRVPLPKGESIVGELPPPAKKFLDNLIAAGVVKVLEAPKPSPPPSASTQKAEPVISAASIPSLRGDLGRTAAEPTKSSGESSVDPSDASAKRKRSKDD